MFQHVLNEVFKKRKTTQVPSKPPLHHTIQDRFVNIITVNNPTRQKHYYARKERHDEKFGDEEILNEARGFAESPYSAAGAPQTQNVTINVPSSTTTNLPSVTTPEKSWWEKGLEGAERIGEMGLEFGLAGAIAHKFGGGAIAQGASMGLIEEAKSSFPRLTAADETPRIRDERAVQTPRIAPGTATEDRYTLEGRNLDFKDISPETGRKGYVPMGGSVERSIGVSPIGTSRYKSPASTRAARSVSFSRTPMEEKEREVKTPLRPVQKTPTAQTPIEERINRLAEAGFMPDLTKGTKKSPQRAKKNTVFNKIAGRYLQGEVPLSSVKAVYEQLGEKEKKRYVYRTRASARLEAERKQQEDIANLSYDLNL